MPVEATMQYVAKPDATAELNATMTSRVPPQMRRALGVIARPTRPRAPP